MFCQQILFTYCIHLCTYSYYENQNESKRINSKCSHYFFNYHQYFHHHVPGLLQISEIMAFQFSLLSVLLMSSLLGDSFLVTKLLRRSVYLVRCLPMLLVPRIFPLCICFFVPSSLFMCPKIVVVLF